MKKILVFGGNGMAGHVITTYLEETGKYDVINTCHRMKLNDRSIMLDVFNTQKLFGVLETFKPDVVVNCIGILTNQANANPDLAIYINSYFPHFLEKWGPKLNFRTIHLSTDCVFSGKKGNYTEDDIPDAEDMYGKSKALGELKNNRDLTIRTSIVGPELKEDGAGLFHWFMRQKGQIKGYTKVFWTGLTTLELAKAIDKAIEVEVKGLWHIVPSKKISKYHLLNLFKNIFAKDDVEVIPSDTPKYDKSLIASENSWFVPGSYETMIKEMKSLIIHHQNLRHRYRYVV